MDIRRLLSVFRAAQIGRPKECDFFPTANLQILLVLIQSSSAPEHTSSNDDLGQKHVELLNGSASP